MNIVAILIHHSFLKKVYTSEPGPQTYSIYSPSECFKLLFLQIIFISNFNNYVISLVVFCGTAVLPYVSGMGNLYNRQVRYEILESTYDGA
jgi:hypothetical protein